MVGEKLYFQPYRIETLIDSVNVLICVMQNITNDVCICERIALVTEIVKRFPFVKKFYGAIWHISINTFNMKILPTIPTTHNGVNHVVGDVITRCALRHFNDFTYVILYI